jgi:hypothetical protein
MTADLHARLVARQTTAELQRKARKAGRLSRIWTQEEIDLFERGKTIRAMEILAQRRAAAR